MDMILDLTPKDKATKAKNTSDHVKLKCFCAAKKTTNKKYNLWMILLNICNKKLIFNKKSNEKMGRGSIQMSFQRYGQQVHEKALNIINHQGNIDTNQNTDTTAYLSEWILLKRQQVTSRENVEEREPSRTAGGNLNWCSLCGKQYGVSPKN